MALSSAKDKNGKFYDVIGVEIDSEIGKKKVSDINQGIIPINSCDDNISKKFKEALSRGNFKASISDNCFSDADIIIIDINLDVNDLENKANINFKNFKNAIRTIGKKMPKDCLVIVETTVPPGTTEEIVYPLLLNTLKERFPDVLRINLAHSYERVMPGENYIKSITDYWRVYAGIDKKSSLLCKKFLETFINIYDYPLTQLSTPRSSETAKIIENSYRAANIAFINEWGLFAEAIGIDIFEIIEAIKLRPTHNNIMRPGLGVGGYCLTKDPIMGSISASQIYQNNSLKFPISMHSMEINRLMPNNVINLINNNIKKQTSNISILVLGLSYREDIDDIRYSPSINLISKMISNKWSVTAHDPLIEDAIFPFEFVQKLPSPNKFEFIILAVPHKFYKNLNWTKWLNEFKGILVDSNNFLTNKKIDKLKNFDFKILKIGRG